MKAEEAENTLRSRTGGGLAATLMSIPVKSPQEPR